MAGFSAVGIWRWAQKQSRVNAERFSCVVASRDIKQGDTLKSEDLKVASVSIPAGGDSSSIWRHIKGELTPPDNTNLLYGRQAAKAISNGSPVLESMLVGRLNKTPTADWRPRIESGKRAISIPVDKVAAVSGLIDVKDRVDILVSLKLPGKEEADTQKAEIPMQLGQGTGKIEIPMRRRSEGEALTTYILQNVEILAVGSETQTSDEIAADNPYNKLGAASKPGANSITVALSPEEDRILAFAMNHADAKFTLTLRNPSDGKMNPPGPPLKLDGLLEFIGMPKTGSTSNDQQSGDQSKSRGEKR